MWTERQVSRESTNELSIDRDLKFSGGLNLGLLEVLMVYRVIWKRNVRTGEWRGLANGVQVSIPYKVSFGLLF